MNLKYLKRKESGNERKVFFTNDFININLIAIAMRNLHFEICCWL